MACRSYPSPEGIINPEGHPYPVLPQNQIRPELADFIMKVKEACEENHYWMEIHSFNHGNHTPNSMHYRGLAVDWDFKFPDASKIYDYMPIDKEAEFICQVAQAHGLDVWNYSECDHLHTSLHPVNYNPDPAEFPSPTISTKTLDVTYG